MKTVLSKVLSLTVLALALQQTTKAQCTVSELIIQNIQPQGTPVPGSCTATFDLSFTIEANNGNKYIFLHVFPEATYPDYFDCTNGEPGSSGAIHPPEASDLVNAFINIGINNNIPTPVLLTSYPPDAGVTLNSADSVSTTILPDGSIAFVVHGVLATFPADCNMPILLAADVWATNSASANVAQCVNCHIQFAVNFMSVSGLANCSNLTFFATVTNRIGTALNGYYQVYADANFDGILSLSVDSLIRDTTAFNLGAGIGTTLPITGPIPAVNINQDLFLVVRITSGVGAGSLIISRIPSTICAPLPVTFGSFTARRINSNTVLLRWETQTEINNNGFAVERNTGNGTWEQIGFVATQASNSNSLLTYTFSDINSYKGVTQYRLRQVDIDSRSKYSEIRAVRGFGQVNNVLVYPNPSTTGSVNVVFNEGEGTRNITLIDVQGRTLKQWNNISGNTLLIDNLHPGYYSLRIQDHTTGDQAVTRFVIAGRD